MFAKLPERFPRKLSAGIRPTTNVFGHVGLQVKNRLVRVFQKTTSKEALSIRVQGRRVLTIPAPSSMRGTWKLRFLRSSCFICDRR